MATIAFRLGVESLGAGELVTVTPVVDGVSLVELARRAERGPARAGGEPALAGAYAGLVVGDADWTRWYLDAPQTWFGDGDACLLGCTCGDTGCWPLTARVELGEHEVGWSGFRTGHRPWDLGALGPFVFDRSRYEAALAAAARPPAGG